MGNWIDDIILLMARRGQAEALAWIKANRQLLARIGRSTFRSYMLLAHEGRDSEAFALLAFRLSAEEIMLRMEDNAAMLDKYNADRDEFLAGLAGLAGKVLLPVAMDIAMALLDQDT